MRSRSSTGRPRPREWSAADDQRAGADDWNESDVRSLDHPASKAPDCERRAQGWRAEFSSVESVEDAVSSMQGQASANPGIRPCRVPACFAECALAPEGNSPPLRSSHSSGAARLQTARYHENHDAGLSDRPKSIEIYEAVVKRRNRNVGYVQSSVASLVRMPSRPTFRYSALACGIRHTPAYCLNA